MLRSFCKSDNSDSNNKKYNTNVFNQSSGRKVSFSNEKQKLNENNFDLNIRYFPRFNKKELQENIRIYEAKKNNIRKEYFKQQKNTEELKQRCETNLRSATITNEEHEDITNRLKSITYIFNKYRLDVNQRQREYTMKINSMKKELYFFKNNK